MITVHPRSVPPPPPPPPGGGYVTLTRQDWSVYPDKASLTSKFGCEGGRQDEAPAIDPDLLFDLVPDPVFGKAIRYNGDPALNSSVAGGARIATHSVSLAKRNTQPSPAWLPQVEGDGSTYYYPADVWGSQFVRFDPWWTTFDYKAMFWRFRIGGRDELKIGTSYRGVLHDPGNPGAGTKLATTVLPITNVKTINAQYNTSGYQGYDLYPIHKRPSGPPAAPFGDGNGEWYQFVRLHRKVGFHRVSIVWWRQYTVGGIVNPQAWKISGFDVEFSAPGSGVNKYEMGVNRNDKWPAPMCVYWGPYEIVDGSLYPNPWGMPL